MATSPRGPPLALSPGSEHSDEEFAAEKRLGGTPGHRHGPRAHGGPRGSVVSIVSAAGSEASALDARERAAQAAQFALMALDTVLSQLDIVAQDRIRDAKTAKILLLGLIRAVRNARREAAQLPTQRIVNRLCYYANARDTGIRSGTFRALRYVMTDEPSVRCVCQSRLVLSIIRSLEREPKLLWERVQALKVCKLILQLAPACFPISIIRSLAAIAQHSSGEDSHVASPSSRPQMNNLPPKAKPGAQAGLLETALNEDNDQGQEARLSAGGVPPVDNLRRVVIDTLRQCAMCPVLVPTLDRCGIFGVLLEALMEMSNSSSDQELMASILLTFITLLNEPTCQKYIIGADLFGTLASAYTSTATHTRVTAEHRASWSVARYILVSFCRSWGGVFALSADPFVLSSLFACVLQSSNTQLSLSILFLVLELLCPPGAAMVEGLHELAGCAPAAFRLRFAGLEASSEICDPALAQSVAVAYRTWKQRLSAKNRAATRQEPTLNREAAMQTEIELRNSSLPESFAMGQEYLSEQPNAAADTSSPRENSGAEMGTRWGGLAVPYFVGLQLQHEGHLPETYGSFWLRVRMAQSKHVQSAGVGSGAGLTVAYFADCYRSYVLLILLQAGLPSVLSCLGSHTHPLLRLAGSSLLHYVCGLSLRLLPSNIWRNTWSVPDIFQMTASGAARAPLPCVRGARPTQTRGRTFEQVARLFCCTVEIAGRNAAIHKPVGTPLISATESRLRFIAERMLASEAFLEVDYESLSPAINLELPGVLAPKKSNRLQDDLAHSTIQTMKSEKASTKVAAFLHLLDDPATNDGSYMGDHNARSAAGLYVASGEDDSAGSLLQDLELDELRESILWGRLSNAFRVGEVSRFKSELLQSQDPLSRTALAEATFQKQQHAPETGSTYVHLVNAHSEEISLQWPRAKLSSSQLGALGSTALLPLSPGIPTKPKRVVPSDNNFYALAQLSLADGGCFMGKAAETLKSLDDVPPMTLWDAVRSSTTKVADGFLRDAVKGYDRTDNQLPQLPDEGPVNIMGLTSVPAYPARLLSTYESGLHSASRLFAETNASVSIFGDSHCSRAPALAVFWNDVALSRGRVLVAKSSVDAQMGVLKSEGDSSSVWPEHWVADARSFHLDPGFSDVVGALTGLSPTSTHSGDQTSSNSVALAPASEDSGAETSTIAESEVTSKPASSAGTPTAPPSSFLGKPPIPRQHRSGSVEVASAVLSAVSSPLGKLSSAFRRGSGAGLEVDTSASQAIETTQRERASSITSESSRLGDFIRAVASPLTPRKSSSAAQLHHRGSLPMDTGATKDAAGRAGLSGLAHALRALPKEPSAGQSLKLSTMSSQRLLLNVNEGNPLDNGTLAEHLVKQRFQAVEMVAKAIGVSVEDAESILRIFKTMLLCASLPSRFDMKCLESGAIVMHPNIHLPSAEEMSISGQPPFRSAVVPRNLAYKESAAISSICLSYEDAFRFVNSLSRPFLSHWLRCNIISINAFRSGFASQNMSFGSVAQVPGRGNKERDQALTSQVAAALSSIRVSKVLSNRDWRHWDWGTISVILDHFLTNQTIFGEVFTKTAFVQRLGDFFGTCRQSPEFGASSGTLFSVPWVANSLKFMRCAKQWITLCLNHSQGRELVNNHPRVPAETYANGISAETFIALWCLLSKTFRRLVRANGQAAKPQQGFVAAATRFFGATARSKETGSGTSDPEQRAAQYIRDILGQSVPGDNHASLFSRTTFSTCLARELLGFLGIFSTSPDGRSILKGIPTDHFFALPDSPDHGNVIQNAQKAISAVFGGIALAIEPKHALLSLVHIPASSARDYVARQLLHGLDFSEDLNARFILLAWISSYRQKGVLETNAGGDPKPKGPPDASTGTPLSALPVQIVGVEERGPIMLSVSRSLALFCVGFFRVLLRRDIPGFSTWCVDALCHLLVHFDGQCRRSSISILVEACLRSRVYKLAVLARQPDLGRFSSAEAAPLLSELVTEPAGSYLLQSGQFHSVLRNWAEYGYITYFRTVQALRAGVFSSNALVLEPATTDKTKRAALTDRVSHALLPRCSQRSPVFCFQPGDQSKRHSAAFCNVIARTMPDSLPRSVAPHGGIQLREECASSPRPIPICLGSSVRAPGSSEDRAFAELCLSDSAWGADMDAMSRLPWRVELWAEWERLSNPTAGSQTGDQRARRPSRQDVMVKQTMRMEIPTDTVLELSTFKPESPAVWSDPDEPELFVKGTCLDPQGLAQPFLLPQHATVKAALYCGVYPVSILGDFPATTFVKTRTKEGQVGVYDSVEDIISRLHKASSWCEEAVVGQGEPTGSRGVRADSDIEDIRSERTGGSHRESRPTSEIARHQMGEEEPTPSSEMGLTVEDAALRLRKRNIAAVSSLGIPVQMRHSNAWVCDAGIAEAGAQVEMRPRTASWSDIKQIHGGSAVSALPSSSRLPDYITGGPDANTVVYSSPALTCSVPSHAGAVMREGGDRYAVWNDCVAPTDGDTEPDSGPPSAGESDAPEHPPADHRRRTLVLVPPGSNARFTFVITPGGYESTGAIVKLVFVEFALAFFPKFPQRAPLPRSLFSSVSATEEGLQILIKSGYLPALMDVWLRSALVCEICLQSDALQDTCLEQKAALLSLALIGRTNAGYGILQAIYSEFPVTLDACARGVRLLRRGSSVERGNANRQYNWYDATMEPNCALRMAALEAISMVCQADLAREHFRRLGWEIEKATVGWRAYLAKDPEACFAHFADKDPSLPVEALDDTNDPQSLLFAGRLPTISSFFRTILDKIGDLTSRVSQREARLWLVKTRVENPETFASPALYLHVHAILSRYPFPLPVRRFIHSLFDRVSFSDNSWSAFAVGN